MARQSFCLICALQRVRSCGRPTPGDEKAEASLVIMRGSTLRCVVFESSLLTGTPRYRNLSRQLDMSKRAGARDNASLRFEQPVQLTNPAPPAGAAPCADRVRRVRLQGVDVPPLMCLRCADARRYPM